MAAACNTAFQSPVDLTDEGSEPCAILCDLVLNEMNIADITPLRDANERYSVEFAAGATWNGSSVATQGGSFYTPAQHTVNGARYDGELVLTWSMGASLICTSFLLQTSGKETSAGNAISALLANATDIAKGGAGGAVATVSLTSLLPTDPQYFSYEGTTITPQCLPCTWVVFRNPISVNADDVASLNGFASGFRELQPLGNSRKLFINDGKGLGGTGEGQYLKNDGRVYIKCNRLDADVTIARERAKAAPPIGLSGRSLPVLPSGLPGLPSLPSVTLLAQLTTLFWVFLGASIGAVVHAIVMVLLTWGALQLNGLVGMSIGFVGALNAAADLQPPQL